MIMNAGLAELANLAGGVSAPVAFTYAAYGTGTTAAAATQTALVTENQRAAATVTRTTTTAANDTTQWAKTFSITTTETIAEVGIFNDASAGTMLARTVLSPTRAVVSGDSFTITYKVVFA